MASSNCPGLVDYDSSSNDEESKEHDDMIQRAQSPGAKKKFEETLKKYNICSVPTLDEADLRLITSNSNTNLGTTGPNVDLKTTSKKNTLTGYVELAHVDECQFELQRRIHNSEGASISKRKKVKNDDPSDIEGYLGPWGGYENEERVSRPKEEDAAILAEYAAKKQKKYQAAKGDDTEFQEKAVVHIKDPYDYQGRSFLHAPRDLDGVNLNSETSPDGCRVPRRLAHTYNGHSKPISAIRFFPKSAHLLLSSSMDHKIKIWELYKERRCIMTYLGHQQAVRDICFDQSGAKFISAGYDKYLKLWDTETGQCINRFTNKKIAYCVKFNPDADKSHLVLAGMSDKKILCWDTRTAEIVQEYDRHLGSVNSITFVDENKKFITTSDDKSLRVWEWDIPVDVKYIADPTLHSMPAVTPSLNCKRLLCQSMDNRIQTFTCQNRFKLDTKKVFKGHMVAGYACVPDFSCDMKMVISGDADGRIFFWDWSSTKIITSFKAHDNVCICVLWHPHERQKLISAGWDNLIKIWD